MERNLKRGETMGERLWLQGSLQLTTKTNRTINSALDTEAKCQVNDTEAGSEFEGSH